MKVSLNWVREFTPVDLPIDKLTDKIGAQLGAIESVEDLGKKYRDILVVKVISSEKHPGADKLSVCVIDAGKAKPVRVVCGAPNVKAGQLAVWIPPGAIVPSTYGKEPFVIEARDIRGVTSHGMLASAQELDIGDDHHRIVELENGKPGDSFAKTLWLDDYIIDIENKMFTHRPDCFGVLGVAREISGILQQPFKSPDWYREDISLPADGRKNVLSIRIENEVPELVPRFCAVVIKDVKVGPSPLWLQSFLARAGIRPINNIVDITNLVMLETAQPLHAYDYGKLKTGILGARLSKKGEKLELLGGKAVTLNGGAVVITDGQKPVGLGGVMGGAGTEVDSGTKIIVLEAASFDMNLTRKTAMVYGLFTDAATRFTKGQSPLQNMAVLCRAVGQIQKLAGGRVASPVADDRHLQKRPAAVRTNTDFINSRLGLSLTAAQIKKILENVELRVDTDGDNLSVAAPFWRTDIEIAEDVVEEVGRLYGYDKLPAFLPMRSLAPADANPILAFKDQLRGILSAGGANEVLTHSFVHGSLLQKAGQDPKRAYQIANALSPDLQYYRLSLVPSLLDKVNPNIKAGCDDFALFEIGKGHLKGVLGDDGLPKEIERLVLVVASKDAKPGAPYFVAKKWCEYTLRELGVPVAVYGPIGDDYKSKTATYYEPGRSAEVQAGGLRIGRLGEFRQSAKTALKLPGYCAGLVLHIDELMNRSRPAHYLPLNRFPELEQDFCLRSAAGLSYSELSDFMRQKLDKLSAGLGYSYRLDPLDIFQRAGDQDHKQTTWRIALWHPERTLTTEETNKLLDKVAESAKKQLNAERI